MACSRLVLVVEDDEDIYELLSDFLAALGYSVAGAGDGRQALLLAHRLKPALVILDMVLPEMSGAEVARALRSDDETRRIPILALTGMVRRDGSADFTSGCDALLAKPCSLDRLEEEVRRLIEGASAPASL